MFDLEHKVQIAMVLSKGIDAAARRAKTLRLARAEKPLNAAALDAEIEGQLKLAAEFAQGLVNLAQAE